MYPRARRRRVVAVNQTPTATELPHGFVTAREGDEHVVFDSQGRLLGRMRAIPNAPHRLMLTQLRIEPGGPGDPVTAAAALVEAGVREARGQGIALVTLVIDDRLAHAATHAMAASEWGFKLDEAKVLYRADVADLQLSVAGGAPLGAAFVAHDAEVASVLDRTAGYESKSLRGSDEARAILLEFADHCRACQSHYPEDWVVLRIRGRPVGIVLPAFTDHTHQVATNLYMGVVPEARGCGLGAVLVRRGIETMIARGALRFVGSCDIVNTPMRRIFQKFGCVAIATQRVFTRRVDGVSASSARPAP